MNFRRKIVVNLLLYTALCGAAFAQVVHFPDPNLRAAVAEKIGADPARITADALQDLTVLRARGQEIENVEGLQHARNLTRLNLGSNLISDITPLAGLTNLSSLTLYDNRITNINALSGLKQLQELHVQNNAITEIDPLSELVALEHLRLEGNLISDITPLADLVNLEALGLHRNAIMDISPLVGLTNLRRLTIENNAIMDISPLAGLTNLVHLSIDNNSITDISPLAGLMNLRHLTIQNNFIADHSPVYGLALDTFIHDQICDMPPQPLEPRLANRTFPSIFRAFSGAVLNRPDLETIAEVNAVYDLVFTRLPFGLNQFQIGDDWQIRGVLASATEHRNSYLKLNPNFITLAGVHLRANGGKIPLHFFPDDHPYWLRLPSGELAIDNGRRLVNFAHPAAQDIIVGQALAVARCGLYDGVFFDWWREFDSTVGDLISLEDAQRARKNIIDRIRAGTRDNFLIVGNTNENIAPLNGPKMNGGFMEALTHLPGTPREQPPTPKERELVYRLVRNSLQWLETNLREPRTVMLEGAADTSEPPDSPYNLQLMRATTTMSLTHSNGYVLFGYGGHEHYWYDFWDADLGRPVGPKFQFYEEIEGLYIREFTNGWAVYNQSGEAQIVTLPEEVQSVANGRVNTEHALLNFDGDIYLRTASKEPADVNGDGMINILDLVLVAQGLGTDDSTADVNGDGVVNVFDLVFVANQF